jgi:hypothetical protein
MNIRDWNPADGMAFQGDIAIIPVPAGIEISTTDEIAPRDGRLIIQEGEVSGHHHAIHMRNFRAATPIVGDPATATRDPKLRKALGGRKKAAAPAAEEGVARLYRDAAAAQALVRAKILTRTDLMVGLLVVSEGPVVIDHEEHDGIRVPVGRYYVGRQIESAGAEQRVVAD